MGFGYIETIFDGRLTRSMPILVYVSSGVSAQENFNLKSVMGNVFILVKYVPYEEWDSSDVRWYNF